MRRFAWVLAAFLAVPVAGAILLFKGCAMHGRHQAETFCGSIPSGASSEDLRQRAEGRARGEFHDSRVKFVFPWWIDNAYECRVELAQGRVVGRELLTCGSESMPPDEARGMGGEVAAQVPENVDAEEWVEVNVCQPLPLR